MVPDLPVGREPGWESQDPGEEGVNSTLQSISERSENIVQEQRGKLTFF